MEEKGWLGMLIAVLTIVALVSQISGVTVFDGESLVPNPSEESPSPSVFSAMEPTQDQEWQIVNDYVLKCESEIVPEEVWESLTNDELYYILNGIYAFGGYYFESGYYTSFPWYRGNVMPEDFTEDMLNHYQHKNVATIIDIMKERGIR